LPESLRPPPVDRIPEIRSFSGCGRSGAGAGFSMGTLPDYGIPGCDRLRLAATIGLVQLTVFGLDLEVDERHSRPRAPAPDTQSGG